jgi:hypothetical protein
MVDPFAITKYDRSKSELEEMLLFCVLVAGKPARRTAVTDNGVGNYFV